MKSRMKAAVLHRALDMRIEEVNVPEIGREDVLVNIKAVRICALDVHYYLHGKAASFVAAEPLILGHECAGEVTKVGDGVSRINVGQRVVIEPGFPCAKCRFCTEGRYNLCMDVLASWRYGNVFPAAINCVSQGKAGVKSMITHRFPLARILEGFETQIKKIRNPIKIQILI